MCIVDGVIKSNKVMKKYILRTGYYEKCKYVKSFECMGVNISIYKCSTGYTSCLGHVELSCLGGDIGIDCLVDTFMHKYNMFDINADYIKSYVNDKLNARITNSIKIKINF